MTDMNPELCESDQTSDEVTVRRPPFRADSPRWTPPAQGYGERGLRGRAPAAEAWSAPPPGPGSCRLAITLGCRTPDSDIFPTRIVSVAMLNSG